MANKRNQSKQRKTSKKVNKNNDAKKSTAASSSSSHHSSPQIDKLSIECFEHIFEWPELHHLLQFRRTSKRIKQM